MNGAPAGPATLVVLAAGRARRYGGCKPLAPLGPMGEAVIDLVASDALAAGFDSIVLVIGPSTGPAIRYHVERTWPRDVDVRFARQDRPRGTVDAVLAAVDQVAHGVPFAVGNADDLYGRPALSLAVGHIAGAAPDSALVTYRLGNAVVGDSPVTRGVCRVDDEGFLVGVDERRQVMAAGGGRFMAKDGREPAELDGDVPVSMNLWVFAPRMWDTLRAAMDHRSQMATEDEVLLPEVVAEQLSGRSTTAGRSAERFAALATDGRCIGVTHPDDLPLVQEDIARQVARGERPALLWSGG
jgi:MobA-like NTP transferase domain